MRQIGSPADHAVAGRGPIERLPMIALVDEDAAWRSAAAAALHACGFRVEVHRSIEALMTEDAAGVPDVLVVDASAPGVDPLGLHAGLRTDTRFARCPVLLLTGREVDEAVDRLCEVGAVDVFAKSTRWVALSARLKHLHRLVSVQRELLASQERLAIVYDSSRAGSFDFDLDAREFRGSAGSFAIMGFEYPRVSISEHEFMRLIPDEAHRLELRRRTQAAIRFEESFSMDLPMRTIAGQRLVARVEVDPYRDAGGRVSMLRGVIRDITDRVRAEADIERLTSADVLTGLPNRNRFIALCAEAVVAARAHGGRLAIVALDLDSFRRINESLGQVAGDEVMCLIGERLSGALAAFSARGAESGARPAREPLLARLPGDEFAILLPRVRDQAEINALVDSLLVDFRRPFAVAGTECFVSCCAGIAVYPDDGDGAGLLLSRADAALAAAKALGSQTVKWYGSMRKAGTGTRLTMLSGLHKALERGEFELHYQPCVDALRATPVGVEALVRWRRDGVIVPPIEFIDLAEESGLIVPIGEWAIREACTAMRAWHDAGTGIPQVSVNVSTLHFERPSLAQTVRDAIRAHGLSPGMLELELTESCTVRDFDSTLGALQALRELGVGLSLDDFGTGYSSLSYLTRLPIRKLKIDRSFVRMLGVSAEDEAVVRAIVALGRSLRRHLVAEGVETPAQARTLLAMGCRDMQGFLFAPAVPAHELVATIDRIRAIGAVTTPGKRAFETPVHGAVLSGEMR